MKSLKLAVLCVAALSAWPLNAEEPGKPDAVAAKEAPAERPKAPATSLSEGYRGTTLALDYSQLLFLKKGDQVDVLVTFDAERGEKGKERREKVTATILQNVAVINVSKPAKPGERGALELLLNPVEAQYAALAMAQGAITIALRALGDTELHPMEMASFRKLIK